MEVANLFSFDGSGLISTMSGGTQIVYGTALDTIVYGGTQYVFGGTALNTTLNGGTQHVTNKCALTNTTVNNGVVVVTYDKTVVSDLTMTGGEYRLGTDGGSYNIGGKFAFTGGVFDMTKDINGNKARTYETLKIADLQRGGGTFILNTDLASEMNGDKIEITSAEAGSTYYVQVNDVSLTDNAQVSGAKKLLLITDASENANFVGKSIDKGGIWEILPDIKNGTGLTDASGNLVGDKSQWYLTNLIKKVNNDTEVLLDGSDNSYALWRNTNDTLRKRLGDLHYRANEVDSGGIWARYTGGKFNNAMGTLMAASICTSWVTIKQQTLKAPMTLHLKAVPAMPITTLAAAKTSCLQVACMEPGRQKMAVIQT